MTDTDRIASDHLLHSTPAMFDLDAAFAADMREIRTGWIVKDNSDGAVDQARTLADEMCARMHAETTEMQRMLSATWATLPEVTY